MLYDSAAHIASARTAYADGLTALEASIEPCTRGRPAAEVLDLWQWSNFLLPYQGQDDKALQQRYAALVARSIDIAAPELRQPLPRRSTDGRRIRLGFASAFFKTGTVGMYFRRWITTLDRSRFEVFAYHLHPGIDAIGSEIAASVDHFRHLVGPRWRVAETAAAIKGDGLDVLVYLELGMHSMTFALAALRLAPVQCAAWGHPTTTGHRTVDYYLSAASMEPPDAARHYSERLVLLPGIGTQYSPPAVPDDTDRARFALPERVLLLCPQSLFKIHPDNDDLLAAVVAAALEATLVLFEGRHPVLTDRFMRRLERAFAARGLAIRERAIVLPSLSHPDYLRVNRACDAMLDTLHWSGGNTSLDALACGLPVVTLPGALMRGRQTAGMLQVLGAQDLIAANRDEYVRIAVKLATDPAWRNEQRGLIDRGRSRLFDDRAPIDRLQAFLQDVAVADVRS
jgi:CRISPR-associated protein Csy1